MRFAGFRLEAYGPFEELELALDPAPGRINLLVADNGYGKSVMREAIGDFLFGIPERSPMSFGFGTERMRLAADVIADARAMRLIRRKGRGGTLADAAGAEVSPETVRALLGGADGGLFRELFGLDTELLRQGGRALIDSQGRLGQVLFAASGGLGRLRELGDSLADQRDKLGLAARRHKSRPIWAALTAFEDARVALTQSALRPDGWRALERDAEAAEAALAALRAEQSACHAALRRCRMVQAVRPWLRRREAAVAALDAALGTAPGAVGEDVPLLDPGFEQRWNAAKEAAAATASAAAVAAERAEAARAAALAIVPDAAILQAEPELAAMTALRGRAQGALADLPAVAAERDRHAAEAARLRAALGWDDATLPPPIPAVRAAAAHLKCRPGVQAEAAGAARQAAERASHRARLRAELAALPEPADAAALADRLDALLAEGEPGARLAAAQRAVRETETAFAAALAAIPDRTLSEAMLDATAAPSEPSLEAAIAALERAEQAASRAGAEVAALAAEQASVADALDRLVREAALPAPGALAAARAERDALWTALQSPPLPSPGLPSPGLLSPGLPSSELPLAFERALRAADGIADALIAHGAEAARADELRQRAAAIALSQARAGTAAMAADAALAAARAALARLASAAGAAPDAAPRALQAFLRARLAAFDQRSARDLARGRLADLEGSLMRLGAGVAEALAATEALAAPEALGPLIAAARRSIEAGRERAARRRQLGRALSEQEEALAAAQSEAARADAALALWSARWTALAGALARPASEPPEAAEEVLALIEHLRAAEADRGKAAQRVTGMEGALAALAAEAGRLASRLAPGLRDLPPLEAAAALDALLQEGRARAAQRQALEAQARAAAQAADQADQAAGAARADVASLRLALRIGEDAPDQEAERQIRRARAVTEARGERARAEDELARLGGGRAPATLAALAEEACPDAEEAEIERLEARQAALAPLIEEAVTARDRAAAERAAAEQRTAAADAAQRRAAAQATLARLAEEALVLHAAARLLEVAIERQAAAADQPLLDRIGAAFRAITAGAHAGVAVEAERMVALAADGRARKTLDQLSEGTRDQLYLALRIAALEDYAARAAPLPFIADDVLQTFDDTRTLAALRALLELSAHVQVIALTHHPHVARLAERLPAGSVRTLALTPG